MRISLSADTRSRDELVLAHLHLAPAIARKIRRSLPDTFELQDLISIGTLALIDAAATFDPSKGARRHGHPAPFAAWAKLRIRGAILNAVKFEARRWTADRGPMPVDVPAIHPAQRDEARREAIDQARAALSPSEQMLVDLVYEQGRTLREVGRSNVLQMGWRRTIREHTRAIDKLRDELEARGFRRAA